MENPIKTLFRSENIILLLIFFFGFFIITYLLKSFGIYEGMTGGDGDAVNGNPINVAEVHNF